MPSEFSVIIVGAGIGGLVAAALLAARGVAVRVYEREPQVGGKVRKIPVGQTLVDAGPTVFTLKGEFDQYFAETGCDIQSLAIVKKASKISSYRWSGDRLDLVQDLEESADAIGRFAGAGAANGYRRFRKAAERVHNLLDATFLRNSNTNPLGLTARIGPHRVSDLIALRPYESLWSVLGEYFEDPRLRQLFARYSTYCGSSPFKAPSTLMLIAHVELMGVWLINGGLSTLAEALRTAAERHGAEFRTSQQVARFDLERGRIAGLRLESGEEVRADAIIANVDPAAIAAGRFGPEAARAVRAYPPSDRSLSAIVWLIEVERSEVDLDYHNVIFSDDYPAEFRAYHAGRLPDAPSYYLCALDRSAGPPPGPTERIQVILNAPPDGDRRTYGEQELRLWTERMLERLAASGLQLSPRAIKTLSPNDFEAQFPSTGGALYGRASHGWAASFLRQSARTRIPGLYCAGGSTHPGAGVPMAALSARLAVDTLMRDHASIRRLHPVATPGGTSTRSATAAASG